MTAPVFDNGALDCADGGRRALKRGHNIRKESYQALAENYSDFGQIYKDLAKASEHAKGKAEAFSAANGLR
jgi:hypothetical protein